jgi:hypothetical protein
VPPVLTTPAVSKESLTVNGTPCSAPLNLPAARIASHSAASYSARSRQNATTALIFGFTSSIRARHCLTASTEEISPLRIILAMAAVDR